MNTTSSNHSHFHGKEAIEHLKEARAKGMATSMEVHGMELSGHIMAALDALRETLIALLFLLIAFTYLIPIPMPMWKILLPFSIGWFIWKTGRSALLGWARLERLHRLIEEERWEIQHHRAQEKEELIALYQVKGLQGKLLQEVVEILMADDNRLLLIMLEEELGLQLHSYEHPLKQCLGAAIGVSIASTSFLLALSSGLFFLPFLITATLLIIASIVQAKQEKNRFIPAIIWTIAISALSCSICYLFSTILK